MILTFNSICTEICVFVGTSWTKNGRDFFNRVQKYSFFFEVLHIIMNKFMTLAEEIIFGGSIVSNKNILVLIFEGDCRLVEIQLKTK